MIVKSPVRGFFVLLLSSESDAQASKGDGGMEVVVRIIRHEEAQDTSADSPEYIIDDVQSVLSIF